MAIKDALEVINQMQSDGVIGRYAIGGAVGATFYIEPASTVDIDIFLELPSGPASPLVSLSPVYEYLTSRGHKPEREYVTIGDWQVQFLPVSNSLEREALETAAEAILKGVRTRVFRPEHLIAIALRTGRAKDQLRVLEFIHRSAFDRDKLDAILRTHGLTNTWEKIAKTR